MKSLGIIITTMSVFLLYMLYMHIFGISSLMALLEVNQQTAKGNANATRSTSHMHRIVGKALQRRSFLRTNLCQKCVCYQHPAKCHTLRHMINLFKLSMIDPLKGKDMKHTAIFNLTVSRKLLFTTCDNKALQQS